MKNSKFLLINLILTSHLLLQNYKIKNFNHEISDILYSKEKDDNFFDRDPIGLNYPEIDFNKIKNKCKKDKIISSYLDLLTQLEIKLIFLEKEINITKLISFFTARKLYLNDNNVTYDDSKIEEYHDIINWLIIHKSNQIKGIASDKYLACKYVEMKIGKDLCPHRIAAYDKVEEIDFKKIITIGNVILKISNGNKDNIFINNRTNLDDIEKIKKKVIFHFNRNYPLHVPSIFHLYSKKRIILEKMFVPTKDLYEFKILLFNRDIKMIMLRSIRNSRIIIYYYNQNFQPITNSNISYSLIGKFKKSLLEEMKHYSKILSEDFPNFIRVDLYIFHDQIYLSELTFDSHDGIPRFQNIKYFTEGVKDWRRVDY